MAQSLQTPPVETPVATHAPIADPGPLGLSAFAVTTMVLSTVNADLVPVSVKTIVLSLALFYGGAVQVIAGIWEFRKNNTFGATAFSSYGAFWLAYWGLSVFFKPTAAASIDDKDTALGLFLLSWTIFTVIMLIAALRTNVALILTFVALTITFILLTSGHFTHNKDLEIFGGYTGLVTAALAFYTGMAGVVNETWKRSVFPVFKI